MLETFLTGAVGAAIVVAVGNVIMFRLQRKATKEDREDDKIKDRLEKVEKDQKTIQVGVEGLLHDRLYSTCKFFLNKGSIGADELSNIEHLYTCYHALGGNGTGTELYERVQKLAFKSEVSTHEEN